MVQPFYYPWHSGSFVSNHLQLDLRKVFLPEAPTKKIRDRRNENRKLRNRNRTKVGILKLKNLDNNLGRYYKIMSMLASERDQISPLFLPYFPVFLSWFTSSYIANHFYPDIAKNQKCCNSIKDQFKDT